jgi:hypothetical protein
MVRLRAGGDQCGGKRDRAVHASNRACIEFSASSSSSASFACRPKRQIVSEIELQLFLQFLMGELRFMKTHRIMKATSLFIQIEHDRRACERQQKKISEALNKLAKSGNLPAANSILNFQRGQTLVTFIAMELQEKEVAVMLSLDDFYDNREEAIVRRILTGLLEDYSSNLSMGFDAHFAWTDLQGRWQGWASTHAKRIAALKKLWEATGGGKNLDSNPQGYDAINRYYKSIYEELEAGGLSAMFAMVDP